MGSPAAEQQAVTAPGAVTARPAEPRDVEAIARIHVAAWNEAYRGMLSDESIDVRTPELRRRVWLERLGEERPLEFVAVVEVGGEVSGFASGRRSVPEEDDSGGAVATWENMYMEPSHLGTSTGLRIGLALHEVTVESLGSLGFAEVVAFVVDGNDRALRFFERLGWRRDGGSREAEGVRQNRIRYVLAAADDGGP